MFKWERQFSSGSTHDIPTFPSPSYASAAGIDASSANLQDVDMEDDQAKSTPDFSVWLDKEMPWLDKEINSTAKSLDVQDTNISVVHINNTHINIQVNQSSNTQNTTPDKQVASSSTNVLADYAAYPPLPPGLVPSAVKASGRMSSTSQQIKDELREADKLTAQRPSVHEADKLTIRRTNVQSSSRSITNFYGRRGLQSPQSKALPNSSSKERSLVKWRNMIGKPRMKGSAKKATKRNLANEVVNTSPAVEEYDRVKMVHKPQKYMKVGKGNNKKN